MGIHQIDRIADYVRYLQENPQELDLLFKELLIGVTSFFRDPAAWEQLRQEVIPALLASRSAGGVLRAWVPGCSTGEEAYSLAMVFKEALEQLKPVKNFTLADLRHRPGPGRDRQGPPGPLPGQHRRRRLARAAEPVLRQGGARLPGRARRSARWWSSPPQNVIMDPPFTKLDILSCRNLLIYLSPELQKKLIPLFHYSLNPGGVLFLGSAETVGAFTDLFAPLDGKTRLYRRRDQPVAAEPVEFPARPSAPPAPRGDATAARRGETAPANLQSLADQLLLQHFSPPAVLGNDKGDILYISGRTGKYLEPAAGKANWNIFAMAREGLALRTAQRLREGAPAKSAPVTVHGAQGRDQRRRRRSWISRSSGSTSPKALRGTGDDRLHRRGRARRPSAPRRRRRRAAPSIARLAELEQELQQAREEVQTTREEMQTSQEELKSTNEELQSTNEELQSTNEELTTSKEEMQSLNEELQTVNPELQAKVDELSRSNNDMKNLLNSTDIATLFLDNELNVRRFTTPTDENHQADPGRRRAGPITDLASDLRLPGAGRRRARGAADAGLHGEARSPRATAAGSRCASCPTARWRT